MSPGATRTDQAAAPGAASCLGAGRGRRGGSARVARRVFALALAAALSLGRSAAAQALAGNALDVGHAAVAAEHRLASQAGVEMLRAGGNAVDAAVAAALATGVVNPVSSGLGGGGFLVVWLAAQNKAYTVDFRESAPAAARADMYVKSDGSVDEQASRTGGLAVAVPGEPRGLAHALQRFGRLSLARTAAPAIRLARDGFVVEPHLADAIAGEREKLAADPELAAVFLHPDGSVVRAGERLRRPALAATLERLARDGAEPFYEGDIAAEIAAAVRRRGGVLTETDLGSYRPIEREAVTTRYRGATVVGMPPPSSGGGVTAEALHVLEAYDLAAIGRDGVTWLHLFAETCKAVFADRAVRYGDPAFVDTGLARLLAPAHAAAIRSRLRAATTVAPAVFGELAAAAADGGTSHISVIDADGNAAALTTSINTAFGASLSVPGRDLLLNDTMDDFSTGPGVANAFGLVAGPANAIAPGKRPLSSMAPTIVLRGGRVRLVAGASGGPLILTATLQTLTGVLDFGQDVAAAVTAPRVHNQWMPDLLFVEDAVPAADKQSLARLGHRLAPLGARSSVQAVEVVREGGSRHVRAVSDPRKGGIPAGY